MSSTKLPAVAASIAAILTVLVLVTEESTGMAGTVWALHLAPVAIGTWYAGRAVGIGVAMVGIFVGALDWSGAGISSANFAVGEVEIVLRLALLSSFVYLLGLGKNHFRIVQQQSRLDATTGLVNGSRFFELVGLETERSQRYGRPFTIAYLSVENLPIARNRGGEAGVEEVLRKVAHFIRGSLRNLDVVAHLRDHEFALLLPETGAEAGRIVLNRLRRNLTVSADDDPSSLWFAIGATTWLRSQIPVQDLYQRTYQLMYNARGDGSNLHHEVLDEAGVDAVPPRRLVLLEEGTEE